MKVLIILFIFSYTSLANDIEKLHTFTLKKKPTKQQDIRILDLFRAAFDKLESKKNLTTKELQSVNKFFLKIIKNEHLCSRLSKADYKRTFSVNLNNQNTKAYHFILEAIGISLNSCVKALKKDPVTHSSYYNILIYFFNFTTEKYYISESKRLYNILTDSYNLNKKTLRSRFHFNRSTLLGLLGKANDSIKYIDNNLENINTCSSALKIFNIYFLNNKLKSLNYKIAKYIASNELQGSCINELRYLLALSLIFLDKKDLSIKQFNKVEQDQFDKGRLVFLKFLLKKDTKEALNFLEHVISTNKASHYTLEGLLFVLQYAVMARDKDIFNKSINEIKNNLKVLVKSEVFENTFNLWKSLGERAILKKPISKEEIKTLAKKSFTSIGIEHPLNKRAEKYLKKIK